MIPVPITWVHEPSRLKPGSEPESQDYYAPLIEAVARHAGVTMSLRYGLLRDVAPDEGFIFFHGSAHPKVALDECALEKRSELASRLVSIGEDRAWIFEELLEDLSIAAAVDFTTFVEWKSDRRGKPGARGPYGLRDIGAQVGASCLLFESPRYCYLQSSTHHGLPHLLADYLAVYAVKVLLRSAAPGEE